MIPMIYVDRAINQLENEGLVQRISLIDRFSFLVLLSLLLQ
jgi:hypothetical protein